MPEKESYNLEEAQEESAEIRELVGSTGAKEDYEAANALVDETKREKEYAGDDEAIRLTPQLPEQRNSKSYIYKEIDRIGEAFVDVKREMRVAQSREEKEALKEREMFLRDEFGKAKEALGVWKEKIGNREERFEKILKDKLSAFPSGWFESMIPDVDSINIRKGDLNKEGGVDFLLIDVVYQAKDAVHTKSFKLFNNGVMTGRIPEDLHIDKDELYDNVLYIAETAGLDFFVEVDDEILPPDEPPKIEGKGGEWQEQPTDPRRLRFMEEQPEVLFALRGKNSGFRGYHGYVFPKFIVFENNKIGNALFFREFESPVEIDKKRFMMSPGKRLAPDEREKILKENWSPLAGLTKEDLARIPGVNRKYHPHMDNEMWEEKMNEQIRRRSA